MLIGYARVSTADQKLDPQRDELKRAGCRKVFTDIVSGANADRPGRAEALAYARKGDTIVVPRLDRFGRSLVDLVHTVHELRDRHVGFRSLHESIDTTTSGGRLIFHVFSALAEFERDLIRERTMSGLAAARARGRHGGRPPVLDDKRRALLHSLAKDRTNSPAVICATLGISRSSFYRYLGEGPSKPRIIATAAVPAVATSATSRNSPGTRRAARARSTAQPPSSRTRSARPSGPRIKAGGAASSAAPTRETGSGARTPAARRPDRARSGRPLHR
jgi:DNA invertase Pin-like site-specific DNA recombinase